MCVWSVRPTCIDVLVEVGGRVSERKSNSRNFVNSWSWRVPRKSSGKYNIFCSSNKDEINFTVILVGWVSSAHPCWMCVAGLFLWDENNFILVFPHEPANRDSDCKLKKKDMCLISATNLYTRKPHREYTRISITYSQRAVQHRVRIICTSRFSFKSTCKFQIFRSGFPHPSRIFKSRSDCCIPFGFFTSLSDFLAFLCETLVQLFCLFLFGWISVIQSKWQTSRFYIFLRHKVHTESVLYMDRPHRTHEFDNNLSSNIAYQ